VPRQSGTALDTDAELLTTRGFVSLRDIREGDEVFHPDGHSTRITFVSDVMHGHDCYRVTMTDGRSVVADRDHLWTVQDRLAEQSKGPRGSRVRSYQWRTMPTHGLVGRLMRQANRTVTTMGKQYISREFRFRLPSQGVVKSEPVNLPIDPYVLGVWLGDGASLNAGIHVGHADIEATTELLRSAGCEFVSLTRRRTAWTGLPAGLQRSLRALGLLGDKHVPDDYLTAGTDQRLALLQGLLDTDGSISTGNSGTARVEFCSTRKVLADAVLYLARSLGWRATIRENAAVLNGREVGRRWRVCFTPEAGDPVPFRLPRKAARIQASRARGGELHAVSIASIEPVPSRPVRCIKVESPDGLFLAGRDLVATHNGGGYWRARTRATLFGCQRCPRRGWRSSVSSAAAMARKLWPSLRSSRIRARVACSAGSSTSSRS
jgi:LAGLIDADG-like domain